MRHPNTIFWDYFLNGFGIIFVVCVAVFIVFIEPQNEVLEELEKPAPHDFTAKPGDTISYTRTFIQHRDCPSNQIIRALTCDNGYRYLYPSTSGRIEPGTHVLTYKVTLPKDLAPGICVYNVTLITRCLFLDQHHHLLPIHVKVE